MNVIQLQELYASRLDNERINDTITRTNVVKIEAHDISYDRGLSIPRYKAIQPTCTLQDATSGKFRNMLTGEEVDKLENVVFLIQQNSRSLFPKNDFSGVKTCFSRNGYYPAPDVKEKTGNEPLATQCAMRENGKLYYMCKFAEWRNSLGKIDPKGNCPPPCKATVVFLGLDSLQMPFWTTFHSSSLVETKKFLQLVRYKKEEFKRKGIKLELYDFSVTVSLELVTNSRGKFYLSKFAINEVITNPQKRAVFKKYYDELKDRFMPDPINISESE